MPAANAFLLPCSSSEVSMRLFSVSSVFAQPLLALLTVLSPMGCDGPPAAGEADKSTVDSGTDDSGGTDSVGDTGNNEDCVVLADGSCVTPTWVQLPELTEVDGVYNLTLAATEINIAGERHCGRAYNGVYPGPTLVTPARSGDTPRQIRIDLENTFAESDFRSLDGDETCACTDALGEECMPMGHGGCDMEASGEDCTCTNSEGDVCEHMYDFNVTNLHAHGSHIRPDHSGDDDGNGTGDCEAAGGMNCRDCEAEVCDGDASDDTCFYSDDVLAQIHPATGARYRWDVDEDGTHHAGLNWYHPHIHGTTAIQVASGAAGAWVIRGDIDEVPGLAAARERVIVFTTPPVGENGFVPLADDALCSEETLTFNNFAVLGDTSAKQKNLINGVEMPRMVTPPGQVERWRMLNSGFLDESFFGIFRGSDKDCSSWSTEDPDVMPLRQYARDGITMPVISAEPYWFMASGYRIEGYFGGAGVLNDGETWCFVASRFLAESDENAPPVEPAVALTAEQAMDLLASGSLVGILNVTAGAGTATETVPPSDAALAALAPSTDIDGKSADEACAEAAAVHDAEDLEQAVVLQVGVFTADDPDPCECDNYNVNCKNFGDVDRDAYPYDRDLPLGETQNWRVQASTDGHPFHIHINPFLVCPQDNPFDPIPIPHWRDTYLVNLDRKVDLITRYSKFTGAFVFHCHKLTHEDEGMMQLMRICDPAGDPTCGDYQCRKCDEGDLECITALAATDCALDAETTLDAFACITDLGSPTGVCGENACGSDEDCGPPTTCEDNVCVGP